jgi:undecaprenyl pyrophosphate phosphatase UppP
LAIKYLLRYISKNDFKVFVWYRLLLAIIILILYFK